MVGILFFSRLLLVSSICYNRSRQIRESFFENREKITFLAGKLCMATSLSKSLFGLVLLSFISLLIFLSV